VRVTVTVRPREGILDPQGEALRRSLKGLGFAVADVRAGKVFDLDLDVADDAEARRIAEEISESVLSNPLIEQYEVAG
jgi:phosphoribosylformylglycinamidine synthase